MATKLPEISNVELALSAVHVDPALNSRKTPITEASTEELRGMIRTQGLLHPPTIIAGAQLGPKWSKFPHVLIAGFRRFAALGYMKQEKAPFRLAPPTWGMKEAMAANLAENLGREGLSPFELATRCKEMRDAQKMTGPEIAKAVRASDPDPTSHKPLTEGHVNNLIRVLEKVDPSLLAHWQARHVKASIRCMFDLAAIDDKKKQVIHWRRVCGEKIDDNGDPIAKGAAAPSGDKGTGTGATPPADTVKRPSRNAVLKAIDAVKEAVKAETIDEADGVAMVKALEWASGDAPTIEGVNLDKRKAEPAAAAAPMTDEEKAAAKAAKAAAKAKEKAEAAAKAAEEAKAKAAAAKGAPAGKDEAGATGNASA